MSVIEMHSRKQRVGSTVKKFQADVSAYVSQHDVVAHPERIFAVVAVGIPRVDGSHGACIGGDKRREGKHSVAVFAAACGESEITA